MNAQQLELFRLALLRVADLNPAPWGLLPAAFAVHVKQFGFSPEPEDTIRELEYLEEKGFLKVPGKNISPENRAWKITATGRDELAQRG